MKTTGKETEKALQIEASVYMEIAPLGGFVSSLIKDKISKWTFWCPKSVYSDGRPADWFLSKKITEAREYFERKAYNYQIINIQFS